MNSFDSGPLSTPLPPFILAAYRYPLPSLCGTPPLCTSKSIPLPPDSLNSLSLTLKHSLPSPPASTTARREPNPCHSSPPHLRNTSHSCKILLLTCLASHLISNPLLFPLTDLTSPYFTCPCFPLTSITFLFTCASPSRIPRHLHLCISSPSRCCPSLSLSLPHLSLASSHDVRN